MKISQYSRAPADVLHHKLRIMVHFDPMLADWERMCACFEYTSWNAYNMAKVDGKQPDNVAAIGYVPITRLRDYNNLPRSALGETPYWYFPGADGCPNDAAGREPREACGNAGNVVCKMIELQGLYGWPFVRPWSELPARTGMQRLAAEPSAVPICKHTHFLMASTFREPRGAPRRRALAAAWDMIPAHHNVLFVVESTSAASHQLHCHVPNAGIISGDLEMWLDANDLTPAGATCAPMHAILNAARREVLEETGLYLTSAAPVVVIDMSNIVSADANHASSFKESLMLVDVTPADAFVPSPLHLRHPRLLPVSARSAPHTMTIDVDNLDAVLECATVLDVVAVRECARAHMCCCVVSRGEHVDLAFASTEQRSRCIDAIVRLQCIRKVTFNQN